MNRIGEIVNHAVNAALAYVEKYNFSIIPIKPESKQPYIKWEEYKTHRATADDIRSWWDRWPAAMIGIVTGKISNLLVIDCDTSEGYDGIQTLISDTLVVPIVRTPRGGWHLYFRYPEGGNLTVGVGVMPGVDFRGEGGYVIAPPSINGSGKAYAWQSGLALGEVAPPPLPDAIIKLINNKAYKREKDANHTDLTAPCKTLHFLTEGRRDNDLFHAANCLIKGGCENSYAEHILNILAKECKPPFPETEIRLKIDSVFKRVERRERNLKQEVLEWLTLQDGYWNLTDLKKTLPNLTREGKANIDVIIHRLKKDGIIEKYGNQAGVYRTVHADVEPIDFLNCDVTPLKIRYPFGIENYIKTLPKNIIVIAGSPNAGKTAFLLNFARMNQDRFEVHYFSSEMGAMELKERLSKFDYLLDSWKVKVWEKSSDFSDVIRPDAINIIDFLEVHSDFWQVGGMIAAIHDKLDNGIAVIAIQKPKDRDEGLGGQRSLEKPRLYLAMESNKIKIVKAKNWAVPHQNPNGQILNFKIINGCKFQVTEDWRKE